MKNFNDIYEKIYKNAKKPLEEIRKKEITKKIFILISIFIIFIFLLLKLKMTFIIIFPIIIPLIVILCFILLKTNSEYNQISNELPEGHVIDILVSGKKFNREPDIER